MRRAGLIIFIVMMIGLVSCGPGGDTGKRLRVLESANTEMAEKLSAAESELFDLKMRLLRADTKLVLRPGNTFA